MPGTEEENPGARPAGWREAASRLIASGTGKRFTLSNSLTLARILMVPLLVLFLLEGSPPAQVNQPALTHPDRSPTPSTSRAPHPREECGR